MKQTSGKKSKARGDGSTDQREKPSATRDIRDLPPEGLMKADPFSVREAAFVEAAGMLAAAERGDDCLIAQAERRFAQLVRVEPDNPVYKAYRGAARAMNARTCAVPSDQIRWIVEGLLDLNEALGQICPEHELMRLRGIPMSMETQLVAAGCFLALPPDAGRRQKAAGLLTEIQTSRQYPSLPPEFRAAVLLRVAALDAIRGQMDLRKAHLEEALALDPVGPAGGEALRLLYARSPQDSLG